MSSYLKWPTALKLAMTLNICKMTNLPLYTTLNLCYKILVFSKCEKNNYYKRSNRV